MQLEGLGERCKLPQWGLGECQRKSNLMHFSLKIWHHLTFSFSPTFLKNIFPRPFPDHSNSLTFSSFPSPVGTLTVMLYSYSKDVVTKTTLRPDSNRPHKDAVTVSVCRTSSKFRCTTSRQHLLHPVEERVQTQNAGVSHRFNKVSILDTVTSIRKGESHPYNGQPETLHLQQSTHM